jgi:hypothetical protein
MHRKLGRRGTEVLLEAREVGASLVHPPRHSVYIREIVREISHPGNASREWSHPLGWRTQMQVLLDHRLEGGKFPNQHQN